MKPKIESKTWDPILESKIIERVTELERSFVNFLRYYPETIFIEDLSNKLNNAKKIIN